MVGYHHELSGGFGHIATLPTGSPPSKVFMFRSHDLPAVTRAPLSAACAVLGLTLCLVACGDDGDTNSGATSTNNATTSTNSGTTSTNAATNNADAGLGDAGDTSDVGVDAAPDAEPDAPEPDVGPPLTCATSTRVEGVMGETVSVELDTRTAETRPRDLGLACGNTSYELRWAPQEVVELVIPGEGPVAVTLDTANDGTDANFDTVVQVRDTCERVPTGVFPPTCFNDVPELGALGDFRTRGGFTAEGGETVYVIVTGFSDPPAERGTVDEGAVQLDIAMTPASAPELASGSIFLLRDDTIFTITGVDPGLDMVGVVVEFLVDGEPVDISGDGEAGEEDVFGVDFGRAQAEETDTFEVTILGAEIAVAGFIRDTGVTQVRMRIFDSAFSISAPVVVDVTEAEEVGPGEACGDLRLCAEGLACEEAVCVVSPEIVAACEAATPIELPELMDTAVSTTVTGTMVAGNGLFAGSPTCAQNPGSAFAGAEIIYTLTVPEGRTVDLNLTTAIPETETDTILYIRAACADATQEVACNDDIDQAFRSAVALSDVAAGTYYVFVEQYGGSAAGGEAYGLNVGMRPVLDAGATCDPQGQQNRCANGPCAEGVCP